MTRRSCRELGLCQVETAITFDRPCPQPCAECALQVKPIVVDGSTVAVEVGRVREPEYAISFPFAPGVIEAARRPPSRMERAIDVLMWVALAGLSAAVIGLLAGIARGRGWL
jgi:hypothetical protein